jgi:hypothetical protein
MLSVVGLVMSAAASVPATLRPFSVDFSALSASPDLAAALARDGIIHVTAIPEYAELRPAALAGAQECDMFPESHTFADGTMRRSMAARTVPGRGGVQPFPLDSTYKCQALHAALAPFRALVAEATDRFASALSDLLDVDVPLLSTPDGAHDFSSFSDVVRSGDHLEHIHEYTKKYTAVNTFASPTLDMHVDQGIFIAFTPALETEPSEFHLRRSTGETVRVEFNPDALVFMLGGGAEQIISPRIRTADGFIPRGAPHAVWVPPSTTPRMWYGRMVLPPPGAAVASGSTRTYEDLRTDLIRATTTGAPWHSGPRSRAPPTARARSESRRPGVGGDRFPLIMGTDPAPSLASSLIPFPPSFSCRCALRGRRLWVPSTLPRLGQPPRPVRHLLLRRHGVPSPPLHPL